MKCNRKSARLLLAALAGLAIAPTLAAAQTTMPADISPSNSTLNAAPAASSTAPSTDRDLTYVFTFGDYSRKMTLLPHGLMWQPPLASPNEPRSYMKIMSLTKDDNESINDTNIGGTFPLVRLSRLDHPNEGLQTDIFATAMSRFEDKKTFMADDYRFGVPFTYAIGPWSFKASYEHTSCHVGDEYLIEHHLPSKDSTRNEAVFGAAFRPIDAIRVYGQIGYAVAESSFISGFDRWRYTCGVEWSKPGPTSALGQPYAAFDLEFRGDEDYTPNVTCQVGWQWLGGMSSPDFRVALEYYDGRSPFGQFIEEHESWVSLGFYFDF